MKCPNCGASMKTSGGSKQGQEFRCNQCGFKKKMSGQMSAREDSQTLEVEDLPSEERTTYEPMEEAPAEAAPEEVSSPPKPKPEPEPEVETPKPKKGEATSRVKKRIEKAKRHTEIRQISKDLASRVNDLEIQTDRKLEDLQLKIRDLQSQIDRKVEELQALSVRLAQMVESDDD